MVQQLTTTELIGKTLTQKLNDPDRQVRAKAAETLVGDGTIKPTVHRLMATA